MMCLMGYIPPQGWPPPPDWPPPADDWTPPAGWAPRPERGLRIPPDGQGVLLSPPPGADDAVPAEPSIEEQQRIHQRMVDRMLGMWAREVRRDAHSYYQAAMRAAWTDRAIDYAEDWSPSEHDLAVRIEEVWVRGYRLLTSTYQMERWLRAHRRAADEEDKPDEMIRALRNTLEHLDETVFTKLTARKPSGAAGKKWSIDDLPGKELFLGFDPGYVEAAFGLVSLAAVTDKARMYASIDGSDDEPY
jgi:hypothetical protein